MNVNEIYELMLFIFSKNAYQGYFSFDDFNSTIKQAQSSYTDYILGSLQGYQPNHPQPRVALGSTGSLRQRLTPLMNKSTLTLVNGYSDYPINYITTDSVIGVNDKNIRYVQQNYLASVLNSAIEPINEYPIYLIEKNGFQFYPKTLLQAKLTYIGKPKDIVLAYELDVNGRPKYTTGIQGVPIITGGSGYASATITFSPPKIGGVQATADVVIDSGVIVGITMTNYGSGYDNIVPIATFDGVGGADCTLGTPITSQDPIWAETDVLNILARAVRIVGVSLEDNAASQYATEIKNIGQ